MLAVSQSCKTSVQTDGMPDSMNDVRQAILLACRQGIRSEYFLCVAEGRGL